MSHRLKLTLFVLAFNVIGFARAISALDGLQWLLPVMLATAYEAVLLSRWWMK
jgi:hypothetical protein